MRKLLAMLLFSATVLSGASVWADEFDASTEENKTAAPAEKPAETLSSSVSEAKQASTLCDVCWEKGPFTTDHPTASRVLLFPARVVTAVVMTPAGAFTGMSQGADYATSRATNATWSKIPDNKVDGNVAQKTVKYGPTGLVANTVALPVGSTVGFVGGAGKGAARGFLFLDKL